MKSMQQVLVSFSAGDYAREVEAAERMRRVNERAAAIERETARKTAAQAAGSAAQLAALSRPEYRNPAHAKKKAEQYQKWQEQNERYGARLARVLQERLGEEIMAAMRDEVHADPQYMLRRYGRVLAAGESLVFTPPALVAKYVEGVPAW